MSLPLRQLRALAYLGEVGRSTVTETAAALRMGRDRVKGALYALDGEGLLEVDSSTVPTSFTITDAGRDALKAEMAEGGES